MTDPTLTRLIRIVRRSYSAVERPLVTPCCKAKATLNGVATETGGWHVCPCGKRHLMTDLIVREDAA